MILENVHDTNIGLLKLKTGDFVYIDDMSDVGRINAHIVLSVEKLNKKSVCSTYKFYEFFSNRIHTYYLDHNHPWPALKQIIRK